ncbi:MULTISPECIES: SDR family oxidoreductase [unclassified Streptomyces]|uniref:SDR family oxidoreductase n=1 Tax=unclassified Streptomyces TaxID=2593676 RepID=UPI0011A71909|nr:SDR family oxidoreductase [Streptomyces sp. BK340]TVZ80522.1 enoyl-[acyl-carrier-protein] reductase [NADH] [Streptomyces sp. BK340]
MTRLGLEGRVALVTGATRGLGLATARKLCAAGCHVYLNYGHSCADADAAVASLGQLGGTATALKADVSRPEGMRTAIEQVAKDHGSLDVFVHNTSFLRPMRAAEPDLDGFQDTLEVSLVPLLSAAPALAEAMTKGSGRIVAVSSSGAGRVVPGYVGLGVAKAGLESFVRYLAVELAPHGIAVNAVSTAKLDKGEATTASEAARVLATRTPAGRLTTPSDVADAIALLCTDEAAWIQGQTVTVDGGLGLRA